jgi:hypothetical protein
MSAETRSPRPLGWSDFAKMGEHITGATSLAAQREQIIALVSRSLRGNVDVWLQEDLLHLPAVDGNHAFSQRPPTPAMRRAMKSRSMEIRQPTTGKSPASFITSVSIPLEEQGITLGAIQINRPRGPAFKKDELNLLAGMVGIISVSLVASHRVAVERFRLDQLNLVRNVSAQIANSLSVTELARRVTSLVHHADAF